MTVTGTAVPVLRCLMDPQNVIDFPSSWQTSAADGATEISHIRHHCKQKNYINLSEVYFIYQNPFSLVLP
jgi:hypothetical protein